MAQYTTNTLIAQARGQAQDVKAATNDPYAWALRKLDDSRALLVEVSNHAITYGILVGDTIVCKTKSAYTAQRIVAALLS